MKFFKSPEFWYFDCLTLWALGCVAILTGSLVKNPSPIHFGFYLMIPLSIAVIFLVAVVFSYLIVKNRKRKR